MQIVITNLLDGSALDDVRAALATANFIDGRSTVGWAAGPVKKNTQASQHETIKPVREFVQDTLRAHSVFDLVARPKTLLGPTFSRYTTDQSYGSHMDDPLMSGVRADLAFTLFLSDPETYDGGELIIDSATGDDQIKLPAGSVFVYSATSLHRVAPVTRGERLAAVGWVRSYIRDPAQRELLFDLDTARHRLFQAHGKTAEFDMLSKCSANLMRMWCDD